MVDSDSVCVIANLEIVGSTAVSTCTFRVGAVQPMKIQVVTC